MLTDTGTLGMAEGQECGGRLEVEDTAVVELIQTGTGATNGEVRKYPWQASFY